MADQHMYSCDVRKSLLACEGNSLFIATIILIPDVKEEELTEAELKHTKLSV